MNKLFRRAVYRAQVNWPYWQGNLKFSDVVGYYARQIAEENKRPKRRRIRRPKPAERINYTSKRTYTTEERHNELGRTIGSTLKDDRLYKQSFFHLACDTTNFFAEGRNWPQRRRKTKCTKAVQQNIARELRAECRQGTVYVS